LRAYESLVIFDPSCSKEDIEQEITKITDIIEGEKGKILEINRWGKKKLAYMVKKKKSGFFVIFQFSLSPHKIKRFKDYFKFNNLVLRHNLLRISPEGDMQYSLYDNEEKEGDKL
jgi:small subunit ribosomal protein S6